MTSAPSMPPRRRKCFARLTCLLMSSIALLHGSGCGPKLRPAPALAAPYETAQLWAVAPLANESGVSVVDTERLSDALMHEVQQVAGINTVPVNRVIRAMHQFDMPGIHTPADAQTIMTALDVDGLIIGTVTAYDPYRPMTLGLATQLFMRPHAASRTVFDSRELTYSARGQFDPGAIGPADAIAQAAGVFDASHHDTLAMIARYAEGRHEPDNAYGHDIYLVSMDAFAHFVCHRLINEMLAQEYARILPVAEEPN